MFRRARLQLALALLLSPLAAGSCDSGRGSGAEAALRLGHFPNVTHAQGLVAHATSRTGAGFLEQRLGADVRVEWYVFHTGPTAMEALLSGSLDAVYVGPNPVLNAYARSGCEAVRVLAGAAAGGAALVVRKGAGIAGAGDLRGRRVATPQIGNTQDVACRAWLKSHGLRVTQSGGDVLVVPTAPADQLALFQAGVLDAAWTVEPWVSRLELEAGGEVLIEEKDAVTTVLAASARFLAERPELARRLVAAHRELTSWIDANPAEAQALVRAEFAALTRRELPQPLLDHCWPRIRFDAALDLAALEAFVARAIDAGFMESAPDLAGLVHSP